MFFSIAEMAIGQRQTFRSYTTDDGLISNNLEKIFQDQNGFMWFGSNDGLSIYDGNRFVNFSMENKGLSENSINSFFEKDKDEMWVLHDGGIDIFKQRKFVRTIPISGINTMLRTKDGRILAGGNKGIFEIKEEKKYTLFSSEKNFFDLYEIGDAFITYERSWKTTTLFDKSFNVREVLNKSGIVHKDNYGKYWFFCSPELYLIDTNALKKGSINLLRVPPVLQPFYAAGIDYPLTDADGYYWFSLHNKGVVCIDKSGNIKKFNVSNGLNTNLTSFFFEDAERNIWVAGNGVIKFFNKDLDVISTGSGLESQFVSAVSGTGTHQSVWMAQMNGISCLYGNKVYNFPYPDNLPCTWTRVLVQGDSLWIGSRGLWLFNIHYGRQPRIELIHHWSIPDGVGQMRSYTDGTLLISNTQEFLQVTKSGEIKKIMKGSVFFKFGINQDEMFSGGRDDEGIARWKISPGVENISLKLIRHFDPALGNNIRDVQKDTNGNFWFGTMDKGVIELTKMDNDSIRFRNYTMKQGMVSNFVWDLFGSRQGQLYVGTNRGISLVRSSGDSVYLEDLSRYYGFSVDVFNISEGPAGELWLATPTGSMRVNKEVMRKTLAPRVFFSQVLNNANPDTLLNVGAYPKSFSYKENNFNFEFSATTYRNEDKVLYSYKLEDAKSNVTWSEPAKMHNLYFASLSPGKYMLSVKALSLDNVWSQVPATYGFIIRPPFWDSWWFRMLAVLLVASIVGGVFWLRIRQVNTLLVFRTKISRDLHDEIGSTLSGVSLYSAMAKQQLSANKEKEVSQSLDRIITNADEMLGKMSDIVWAINPRNDNFDKIITRLKLFAAGAAAQKGILLHFDWQNGQYPYNPDMQSRKNIYLICKEAINNAVKYSCCRNLFVDLRQEDHRVGVTIRDDGKGFDVQENHDGNGLQNMQARAREMKAGLSINSEEGKGTTVHLILKIT